MPGVLAVEVVEAGRAIEARRNGAVSNNFWSRARANWGSRGADPSRVLRIDAEHFLAHLEWLVPACRSQGVSIEWGEEARDLVLAHRAERDKLGTALAEERPPLSEVELGERLRGTRFERPLRSFQSRDLSRLLALAHGANFSVPGAGKTTVQLACYEAERKAERVEQMLVAAPLSAFSSWWEESEKSFGDRPTIHFCSGETISASAEIVLVNYQRLLYSYESVAEWVRSRPTLVCLDEAHRIKRGRAGEWGSTCLDLAYLAARRDILTGTPAPQSPQDISVLLDYLWLGQGHRVLPSSIWAREPSPQVGHEVAEAIKPLFVRTTKSDLDLPKVEFSVVPVEANEIQGQIYEAMKNRFAADSRLNRRQQAAFKRMGGIVMYLLEAATNPGLLSVGSSESDPLDFRHPPLPIEGDLSLADLLVDYGTYETPTKFTYLARLLNDNRTANRKTLVWSNFVRNLEVLRGELATFHPAVVHGGVPSVVSAPTAEKTREAELERFREDPDCWVLLANPAALGEGVSLHESCNDAVYLERTFNAGQYLQSLDRIHRLGLAADVITRITFLVCPGTLDEVVAARVSDKAERLGAMLDDPDIVTLALPDEEDVGAPFEASDARDVEALLGHLYGSDG